jgi:hypothetical protein
MNPGELNNKISVMSVKLTGKTYYWEQTSGIWAKVEQLKGNNLFSQVGIGVKSIQFTIRKNSALSLHNAFQWQGKHCFLTNINEVDRGFYEVTAALIDPKLCIIKRTDKPTKDSLNRPVYSAPENITFPGCLVEKYAGHKQENPMAIIEMRYVVVTPKVIELEIGELITIDNVNYEVLVKHTLDEYKNEFEIVFKGDA